MTKDVLRAHTWTAYMVINKTGPHYQLLRNSFVFFLNDLLNTMFEQLKILPKYELFGTYYDHIKSIIYS